MKTALTTLLILGILAAAYFMLRKKPNKETKYPTAQPETQDFTAYSGYFYK